MEGYYELANAIVIRAVEDYRQALRALKCNRNNNEAKYRKVECERFFRSRLYSLFTTVDGEMIIHRLKMEVEK